MQRILILSVLLFSIIQVKATTLIDTTSRQQEINTIIKLTEQYICNPAWLATDEWKTFTTKIQSDKAQRLSDSEFATYFRQAARDLPFSHYNLHIKKKSSSSSEEVPPHFELKEIDGTIAHLVIRSFVADPQGMIQIVQEVHKKGYEHLIIDLRSNGGGTLDAPVILSRFLTGDPIDAGVYMTRNWFEEKERYPTKEEIEQFPFLQDLTLAGFRKIQSESPAFRMLIPGHDDPTFEGEVYVLTNSLTASACEPVVDLLKKKGLATIVGQRTAGQMLNGNSFSVSDQFNLFLPTADYIAASGERIDQQGVLPDVKRSHETALEYVLEQIKKD